MPKRTLLSIAIAITTAMPGILSAANASSATAANSSGGAAAEGSGGPLEMSGGAAKGSARAVTATSGRSGVVGGALFGGNAQVVQDEARLGRRLAIVREYFRIGESFPWPADRTLMSRGSTLLVSLDATNIRYASVVVGHYDARILAFLRSLNQSAVHYHLGAIYISFQHEASSAHHRTLGSPAEFVKAWDHIHRLAESAHLNWSQGGRLHWVLILSWRTYLPRSDRTSWQLRSGFASQYWPGATEVDIVAADGYDTVGCSLPAQSASPSYLFGSVVSFARAHGNAPVFISEWGANAKGMVQPDFVNGMKAYVSANHQVAAALYWSGRGRGSCNFSLQSNGVAALAAMGRSPALGGHITN
jgi:hypothetical protein